MTKKETAQLLARMKHEEETRHIHIPYAETSGRQADFEVEYTFDIDPAVSSFKPHQGMHCDFLCARDDPATEGIPMIWPELLDKHGEVICDKRITPALTGKATMWIGMQNSKGKSHCQHFNVGTEGYWMVSNKGLAKVTITTLLGLSQHS